MHRDLLWTLRWLRKNPVFTVAVVLILALGIGANTAVFSIVDAVLLRPLPYASADRLVRVEESSTRRTLFGVPVQDYWRWADRSDIFEKVAPSSRERAPLPGAAGRERAPPVRSGGRFRCSAFPRAWAGRSSHPT